MKNKEQMAQFLEECIKINEDINRKIPLAANRYAQFESMKADLTEEELKLHDKKYDEHKKYVSQKHVEHLIYQHLNELLAKYLRENKISASQNMTDFHKNKFKQIALKESAVLQAKLIRTLKLLSKNSDAINEQELDVYLQKNIDNLIVILSEGNKLTIDDHELGHRFQIYDELVNHRAIVQKQYSNDLKLEKNIADPETKKELIKKGVFSRAYYFDQAGIDVGFCDEYTSITLKRLYESNLVQQDIIVEKIDITYLDENGEPGDGHTFLAINRDPNSPLNDISKWNGILFDTWNNLVCFTEDYDSLPYRYRSYPEKARWKSTVFENIDIGIWLYFDTLSTYFAMTGHESVEKRIPLLIEEYQLTSLELEGLNQTKNFLYGLTEKLRPDNFKIPIEIFITNTGAKLVDVLAGFSGAKIIIHSDFLKKINGDIYTVEELEFGLANTLIQIQYEGISIYDNIPAGRQNKLDRLTVEKFHNASAGISYFRKSIDFETAHKEDISTVKQPTFSWSSRGRSSASFLQRIKNLTTLLAANEHERNNQIHTALPDELLREVAPVRRRFFYQEECNSCQSTPEKLQYLKSKLSDLSVELFPYEITRSIGIKIRDFCRLLYEMNISLNNPEHLAAINELINKAYELRIPAFEPIYWACLQKPLVSEEKQEALPLGVFKEINTALSDFTSATDRNKAQGSAVKLNHLVEKHKNHITNDCRKLSNHMDQFRATNKRPPKGTERYFGSDLGSCIRWSHFSDENMTDSERPWEHHIEWAKNDDSGIIADTLWNIGITKDPDLWAVFSPTELCERSFNVAPLLSLPREYSEYGDEQTFIRTGSLASEADILRFLSENHLKTFQPEQHNWLSGNIEEQFKRYYDTNIFALIKPESGGLNDNNAVVLTLLHHFALIAASGSEEEKNTVKGFFLGRADNREALSSAKCNSELNPNKS